MRRSRTSLLALATTASLALTLGACSSGGSDDSAAGTAADPVDLTFYMDKAGWMDSFDAENKVSTKEGMQLDVVQTPGSTADAFDSFVKQSFRTDERPDLFTWSTGPKLQALVDQGMVAETTDIWARAEKEGLVPDGLIDNYTYNGKQYCVPLNVAYWVMYYNKHVFEDAGIKGAPTSWDDMMADADTVKDKGVVPFHQMNVFFEFVWFQALLASTDPDAYAGLGTGETKFTDPVVVDVAQQWLDMMHDGYFLDPGINTDPQTLLANGDEAMSYFGSFLTGQLNQIGAKSGTDYGVFPFPKIGPSVDKDQMILETGPLCVGEGAEHEDQALRYSEWWLGDDAQQTWADTRGDVSFNPHVKSGDAEMQALADRTAKGDFQVQQRYQEMVPWPVYTKSREVFGEFVTDAPDDPMDGLKQIQAEADKYWAEQG
ncbi:ABC transporter substrate-binding protein [Cellulomonas sp. PhB143]|uniref:ABC transporter substrate-binding protein n=1 Tax=Cellulomonas sp. PhB143 TaxID=2485186 RepID=UPI000F46D15D|nr:extracellular solute-binding protein [Cellulomonas sp. PhB143]ROS78935.1 carbohydrate ABC transporter substrate-binding protein (CUT1 family) [Cellulomonas sp. PhB143]